MGHNHTPRQETPIKSVGSKGDQWYGQQGPREGCKWNRVLSLIPTDASGCGNWHITKQGGAGGNGSLELWVLSAVEPFPPMRCALLWDNRGTMHALLGTYTGLTPANMIDPTKRPQIATQAPASNWSSDRVLVV